MKFCRAINRAGVLAVLAVGVFAVPSLAGAEEVPSFNLDYAVKHAAHVVVVRADGTVLESWRGDLSAGDKLPFKSSGDPIPVVNPLTGITAGPEVKSVTGRRRVLFLIRDQTGDGWTFAGFLSPEERFGTVWIEDGQCFAQYQFMNPGHGARMHPLYLDERRLKTELTLINVSSSTAADDSVLRILWQRSEMVAHVKVNKVAPLPMKRQGDYKWHITGEPKQVFKFNPEKKTPETLGILVGRIWHPGLPEPPRISIENEGEYLVFLKYWGKGFIPADAVWALPYDTVVAGELEKWGTPDETGDDQNATSRSEDVLKHDRSAKTVGPQELAGEWLLTLPSGIELHVTLTALDANRYRMTPSNRNSSGIYKLSGNTLRMVEPDLSGVTGFEWQVFNRNAMLLFAEPPSSKTGSSYVGATLTRPVGDAKPTSNTEDKAGIDN